MPKPKATDADMAHHEAGHAVVARALGMGVPYVTMFPTAGDNRATAAAYSAVYAARESAGSELLRAYEIDALICMAGVVAGRRYRSTRGMPAPKDEGGEIDIKRALSLAATAGMRTIGKERPPSGQFQLRTAARAEAEVIAKRVMTEIDRLIQDHWSAIERVASALFARRALHRGGNR